MSYRISVLILFTLLTCSKCLSQIDHIRVLLGQSDSIVLNYLDSLNQLRTNSNYKVEKDASSDGDLILHCDFALNDQSFYNCRNVYFFLHRFPDGMVMCYNQNVSGPVEYAASQLNFVKDNYKTVSDNKWERDLSPHYKIAATLEKKDVDSSSYVLSYKLMSKD